jgi:hypothetical protein
MASKVNSTPPHQVATRILHLGMPEVEITRRPFSPAAQGDNGDANQCDKRAASSGSRVEMFL